MKAIDRYNSSAAHCNERFGEMWRHTYDSLAVVDSKQITFKPKVDEFCEKIHKAFGNYPEDKIYQAWQRAIDNAGDNYGNFSYSVLRAWLMAFLKVSDREVSEKKKEATSEELERQEVLQCRTDKDINLLVKEQAGFIEREEWYGLTGGHLTELYKAIYTNLGHGPMEIIYMAAAQEYKDLAQKQMIGLKVFDMDMTTIQMRAKELSVELLPPRVITRRLMIKAYTDENN